MTSIGRRCATAMSNAARTSSVRRWVSIAQPITRRLHTSRMAAGTRVFGEEKKVPPVASDAPKDTHICKGMNDCKGKGGCASDAAKHACKGKNECKGMGGCAAGGSCAGKNDCKGKGGCAVPVNKAHMKTDDKA